MHIPCHSQSLDAGNYLLSTIQWVPTRVELSSSSESGGLALVLGAGLWFCMISFKSGLIWTAAGPSHGSSTPGSLLYPPKLWEFCRKPPKWELAYIQAYHRVVLNKSSFFRTFLCSFLRIFACSPFLGWLLQVCYKLWTYLVATGTCQWRLHSFWGNQCPFWQERAQWYGVCKKCKAVWALINRLRGGRDVSGWGLQVAYCTCLVRFGVESTFSILRAAELGHILRFLCLSFPIHKMRGGILIPNSRGFVTRAKLDND